MDGIEAAHDLGDILRFIIAEENGTNIEEIKPSAMSTELGMVYLLALTIRGKLN